LANNSISEGVITFRPTYRFNRNEVNDKGFRTFSAEKLRVPAWCDRVLWKSLPGNTNGITQTAYESCDEIMTRYAPKLVGTQRSLYAERRVAYRLLVPCSDHSPVYATFLVETHLPNLPYQRMPVIIRLSHLCVKTTKHRKAAKGM
jgi:hypothetical protein